MFKYASLATLNNVFQEFQLHCTWFLEIAQHQLVFLILVATIVKIIH